MSIEYKNKSPIFFKLRYREIRTVMHRTQKSKMDLHKKIPTNKGYQLFPSSKNQYKYLYRYGTCTVPVLKFTLMNDNFERLDRSNFLLAYNVRTIRGNSSFKLVFKKLKFFKYISNNNRAIGTLQLSIIIPIIFFLLFGTVRYCNVIIQTEIVIMRRLKETTYW